MKVFAKFSRYVGHTPDISKLYLGISKDVVEAEVNEINQKVGGGIEYEALDVDVLCGEEVLKQFDDITLMEELKRRKLIQMEMDERLIHEIEESLKKKKFTIPANAISERQVLEVLRLQDEYYSETYGNEMNLSPQEYIIKHWND